MKNFWKGKKVLVTGGAGFIGSNAVKELIRRGSVVTITVSKSSSDNEVKKIFSDLLGKIKIERVDLLSLNDCLKITKKVDVVLNFAALDGGAKFKKEHSEEIYRVNTGIVKNILEASKQNNVDRVLLMSSIEVYPKDIKTLISENDADMSIKKGYVGSKVFSEKLAKKYYDKYGLKIAIARPGNIYGLGDTVNPQRARVIPAFIEKAMDGQDIEISNSANLSFLHVSDLINALLNLVEKYPTCSPVNLVGSEKISLKDLAKTIIKISNSDSNIVNKGKATTGRMVSSKKAKKIIDFIERISLNEGLASLIDVSG